MDKRLTKNVAEGVPVYIGEDSQYGTEVVAAEMTISEYIGKAPAKEGE